jgi:hypothetical protein
MINSSASVSPDRWRIIPIRMDYGTLSGTVTCFACVSSVAGRGRETVLPSNPGIDICTCDCLNTLGVIARPFTMRNRLICFGPFLRPYVLRFDDVSFCAVPRFQRGSFCWLGVIDRTRHKTIRLPSVPFSSMRALLASNSWRTCADQHPKSWC